MNLYDDLIETHEFELPGGEKIRARFRHDGQETQIATDNVSEDRESYSAMADLSAGKETLLKEAEVKAAAVHETDLKIIELLKERAALTSEFTTVNRALQVLDASEAVADIPVYDWKDVKEELLAEGKRDVVFAAARQNKVYYAVVSGSHEKMGEQMRLSYRIFASNPLLKDGISLAHSTKIPDYKSKDDMLLKFEEMQAKVDSMFFNEENPVIPGNLKRKLSIDGAEIPGYRYE